MRVLLLGGSGLLSGAARAAFLDAGDEVTVLSRGERPLPPHPRLRAVRADRGDAASLARALGGEAFDFTADFLAYDAADVERLLGVSGFAPGRLVMISTGQVYLVTREPRPPFREADADAPTIPEPERDTRAWHNWVYGMGKRRAEVALHALGAARGLSVLALRLPVVQGEDDGANSQRLWAWIERLRDGGPVILPDGGAQPVRFAYAGDAAAALVRLSRAPAWPASPALNLAQPAELPLAAFLAQVAALLGVTPDFVAIPSEVVAAAGLEECAPYTGRWCSRPDPSAAIAALDLPTRGPEAYLPSVVRAHLAAALPSHPSYALRSEELALIARFRAGVTGSSR